MAEICHHSIKVLFVFTSLDMFNCDLTQYKSIVPLPITYNQIIQPNVKEQDDTCIFISTIYHYESKTGEAWYWFLKDWISTLNKRYEQTVMRIWYDFFTIPQIKWSKKNLKMEVQKIKLKIFNVTHSSKNWFDFLVSQRMFKPLQSIAAYSNRCHLD